MRVPNVMEVSPKLPVKTVPEFTAYAKANPGKVTFASSGAGTTLHMSGELFKAMVRIDILHVLYRGLGAGSYGHDRLGQRSRSDRTPWGYARCPARAGKASCCIQSQLQ